MELERVTLLDAPKANVLGAGVDPLSMHEALETVSAWFDLDQQTRTVALANVHSVMKSQAHPWLRDFYNQAGLVLADGMPLAWLARLQGYSKAERIAGSEFMMELCRRGLEPGWTHYFYGGAEGVADRLVQRLSQDLPGLKIAGTHCPPFRELSAQEQEGINRQISACDPSVLWVGLGTLKQERWVFEQADRFPNTVLVGVGAAFDFNSGLKARAPQWMQECGLEWLFRLLCEPRRLGHRYLVDNPRFILAITLQLLGLRGHSTKPPACSHSLVNKENRTSVLELDQKGADGQDGAER